MLEKSCGWWLIWYLLFFCHGGAEGKLQWDVKEKVTDYGQNLTLFCPVENCCSKHQAGWFVRGKSKILDVKTFSNDPNSKYHGTYNTDGFGFVIRNLSEADLNVTYHCNYGFIESTPTLLLHGDVFKENVPDKDKDEENNTVTENETVTIVLSIVATSACIYIVVGIILGIAYCVSRLRRKNKKKKPEDSPPKPEEVPLIVVVVYRVDVTFTDISYTEQLNDGNSNEFKSLAGNIQTDLTKLFVKVPGKQVVVIVQFKYIQGSLLTTFDLTSRGYYEESVLRETIEKPLRDGRIGNYKASPVGFTFRSFGGTEEEMVVLNDIPVAGILTNGDILTKRARRGVNALKNNKMILLTGIDGIGKTSTANKIIELYCDIHPEFTLLDLSRIRRLKERPTINYFPSGKFDTNGEKLIVCMDDFLANQHVNYLKEDLDILKMVYRTKCERPGTVEVVLTVDNSCIGRCKEELEQCGLLSDVCLVDLNEEFNNTEDLQELLKEHKIPDEEHLYRDIVEMYRTAQEPKIGFPELCYLFSQKQISRNQGADFFQDPSNSLNEYFMNLGSNLASEEENVFYIALVQIMMSNKLVVYNIPRAEIENMENMFNILYKKTLDVQSLEDIIDKTNGGILIKTSENSDGMYVFQNPLIINFLFNSFNNIISPLGLEKVLEFFTMEFIVDFVRTRLNVQHQSIYPNSITVMVVEEESYPLLADRIMKIVYENGMHSVYRLCLSPLLDDKKFLHLLLEESGKHTERHLSDSLGDNDIGYFPAALLKSVMKYRPSTAIVNIVLGDMSRTSISGLQSNQAVVRVCHRSVKFAMTEACKENCIEQIEIFARFITEHKIDYSDSSFLREACINQGIEAATWILNNIPIPREEVFTILLYFGNDREVNIDGLEWCIEHIYPVEHNTSRHENNKFNIYESIEYFCKKYHTLDLVKYLWTTYTNRIIQNYRVLFPDVEGSVVLESVLGKLMTACLKNNCVDLIIWWVDTEGTEYFDMTAVKTRLRLLKKVIPENWRK